jgi:hypothetical protein
LIVDKFFGDYFCRIMSSEDSSKNPAMPRVNKEKDKHLSDSPNAYPERRHGVEAENSDLLPKAGKAQVRQ